MEKKGEYPQRQAARRHGFLGGRKEKRNSSTGGALDKEDHAKSRNLVEKSEGPSSCAQVIGIEESSSVKKRLGRLKDP